MKYHSFPTRPELRPYVYKYYHLTHDAQPASPISIPATPSGAVGMVFNFGPDYHVEKAGASTLSPRCFLAGQVTQKYTLQFTDKVDIIGAVFWPAALLPLLGLPLIDFVNQQVELPYVLGMDASVLHHRMASQPHVPARLQILEQFLMKKLEDRGKIDLVAARGVEQIIAKRGNVSIGELSDDLCISQRQFHRRFKEVVGLSPKRFARIKRFNLIALSLRQENTDWGAAIYKGGYYDQSHFIRDFQEFFGHNPSQFLEHKSRLTQLATG